MIQALRARNLVERFLQKIKWFRRSHTRYDKLAAAALRGLFANVAALHASATIMSLGSGRAAAPADNASNNSVYLGSAFLPLYLIWAGRTDLIAPSLAIYNFGRLPSSAPDHGFARRLSAVPGRILFARGGMPR